MKNLWVVLLTLLGIVMNAQDLQKIANEIKEEGTDLYRSEMASWYGTDIFRANYEKMDNVSGYFSYIDEKVPKCIFFSKDKKVIGTIAFPTNYNPKDAKLDLNERDFTSLESEYFTIRQNALTRIKNDTIFKVYQNTSLNIVPIIKNNVKKVYVLTGPSVDNVVVFGNDYLISFDNKNEVKNVEKLHKGMIVQNINDKEVGKTVGGVHSHILENWQTITPTDICTLMLYYKFTNWESYTVVSKKYVSMWNGKGNGLLIMKEKAFKNMTESIKKIDAERKSKTEELK
ncbi:hypothetical protein SAMN05421664_0974 [Chryseobacterium soldanellicola]|uniref:Uncharacterized protein n=1 Tax=Chryseobacterium soldanellicola TaxID=311333 RepID=A0A1H0YWD1_9FLAO|nr:hypothetical protein [Chryseobacterium soldanellicola]SDQ19499.1 hypothetical protein SAMN05421664_0974 [Chryseobacterium soldanellicola]